MNPKIVIAFTFFIYSGCAANMYVELNPHNNTNDVFREDGIAFSVPPTSMRLVSPYSPEAHLGVVFTIDYYTDVPVEIILESYSVYFDGINSTIEKDNINGYFSFREAVINNVRYTDKKFWGIKNIIIPLDDLKKMVSPELTGKEVYNIFNKVENISLTILVRYKTGGIEKTKEMTWFYIPRRTKSNAFIDMLMSV